MWVRVHAEARRQPWTSPSGMSPTALKKRSAPHCSGARRAGQWAAEVLLSLSSALGLQAMPPQTVFLCGYCTSHFQSKNFTDWAAPTPFILVSFRDLGLMQPLHKSSSGGTLALGSWSEGTSGGFVSRIRGMAQAIHSPLNLCCFLITDTLVFGHPWWCLSRQGKREEEQTQVLLVSKGHWHKSARGSGDIARTQKSSRSQRTGCGLACGKIWSQRSLF